MYQATLQWTSDGLAIKRKDKRPIYSIQDVTESLSLLFLDLPDPDEGLVPQTPQPLQTFTLFPNLPPELRILIWGQSLPGPRNVALAPYRGEPRKLYARPRRSRRAEAKPPVALYVNQESRGVALSKYTIIWHNTCDPFHDLCHKHSKKPLFINPEIDRVWVHYLFLCNRSGCFSIIFQQNPKFFDAIKALEVREVPLHMTITPLCAMITASDFRKGHGGILNYFANLETIRLIGDKSSLWEDMYGERDRIENNVYDMFDWYYTEIDEVRPELVMHGWRRDRERSDLDYQDEAYLASY